MIIIVIIIISINIILVPLCIAACTTDIIFYVFQETSTEHESCASDLYSVLASRLPLLT